MQRGSQVACDWCHEGEDIPAFYETQAVESDEAVAIEESDLS